MSEWISVKDGLPERDEKCLCWYGFEKDGKRSGMMFMGCLEYFAYDPEPHWQHGSTGLFVTHWMPLHNPPHDESPIL